MKQSQILIRYGEIGLKAEYTRRQFTRQLKNNLLYAFSQENIPVRIELMRGRLFIHTEEIEASVHILQKIFGIVSFSPVWETSSDLNVLTKDSLVLMKKYLDENHSFALRVRRSGNHDFTSQDAAIHIGQALGNRYHSPVNLENPDVELFIEIREDKAFLFFEKIEGVGGLPYGTQGRICCIIENQRDLLASWYLMKRGCSVRFFSTNLVETELIQHFLKKWHIKQTSNMINDSNKNVNEVNVKVINKNCQAICLGVSFSDRDKKCISKIKQSQTRFSLPVLTPLISLNKKEIDGMMKNVL